MTVSVMSTTSCPDWCTDHTGFDDGSDDWHKGSTQTVGKYAFYVTTGNLDGVPEVFFEDSIDALSLDEAEHMARTLLAAAQAARCGGLPVNPRDVLTPEECDQLDRA